MKVVKIKVPSYEEPIYLTRCLGLVEHISQDLLDLVAKEASIHATSHLPSPIYGEKFGDDIRDGFRAAIQAWYRTPSIPSTARQQLDYNIIWYYNTRYFETSDLPIKELPELCGRMGISYDLARKEYIKLTRIVQWRLTINSEILEEVNRYIVNDR